MNISIIIFLVAASLLVMWFLHKIIMWGVAIVVVGVLWMFGKALFGARE